MKMMMSGISLRRNFFWYNQVQRYRESTIGTGVYRTSESYTDNVRLSGDGLCSVSTVDGKIFSGTEE